MRSYDPSGCNGRLFCKGRFTCFTIELPWRNNLRNHSCIPEGRYPLKAGHSLKWGYHIRLEGVPGRKGIVFHPAHYALLQLQGSIAPVRALQGMGVGYLSTVAYDQVKALVLPVLEREEEVYLTIKAEDYERCMEGR
mgnify:FL=1